MKRVITSSYDEIKKTTYINPENGFPAFRDGVIKVGSNHRDDAGNRFDLYLGLYYPGYGDISISLTADYKNLDEEFDPGRTDSGYYVDFVPTYSGTYPLSGEGKSDFLSVEDYLEKCENFINTMLENIDDIAKYNNDYSSDIVKIINALEKDYRAFLKENEI